MLVDTTRPPAGCATGANVRRRFRQVDALIFVFAAAALTVANVSNAEQTAPSAQASNTSEDLDAIVVTGRPLPGAVIGDIPPENQLKPADIAAYGVSTINDLLSEIAGETQSDQGRDSSASPIILVNGKRVSGVNEVGDLPTEAILRVDILPEEVALKYGYGAQQKVVNIILRRRFLAKGVDAGGGRSTAGGGENGLGDLSYSRIRDNDRVNVVGRIKTQEAIRESDRGASSTAGVISDSDARTLKPALNTYTLNAVVAHPLSQTVQATFNATAGLQTSRALDGYPAANLNVPADSPFAMAAESTTLDRFLSNATLRQDVDNTTAHAGLTLNADLSKKWRLSFIGSYDFADARTRTDRGYDLGPLQAAINSGVIDPYGSLPISLLGPLGRQDANAITNTGSASVLTNGTLLMLPAGPLIGSLKLGGNYSGIESTSSGFTARNANRTQTDGQISIDVPLTSRSNHVLSALGDVSINLNSGVTWVSGIGSLGTLGYGMHWTPRAGISVLATVNEDHQVPTLAQLNGPVVMFPNIRFYDYVQGQTVTVNATSGGNPALKADDRHVVKLGASIAAISKPTLKLNLTASYIDSVTRNGIGSLNAATVATENAFPDRFDRDADGMLIAIDERAINLAREKRQSLRWGFNLTRVLRAPTRPTGFGPPGSRPSGMRGRDRSSGEGMPPGDEPAGIAPPSARDGVAGEPAGPAPGTGVPSSSRPEGAPSEGVGARTGGLDAAPGAGPGAGGWGGGRGRGFGGGNGAQLDVSLYHSWYFRDDVTLGEGGPVVDLLNGGTIGSSSRARHAVQLNAGLIDNGIGLRLSGSWNNPLSIVDSGGGAGALHYGALTTLNVRMFIDLQQRFMGKTWSRRTRVTLAFNNVFDARQSVHDANGATPLIYQPAFLDPYGRTVNLAFRRLF